MSESRSYAGSIRPLPGVGLEVDMRDFDVVRLQSGEKSLWYDKDNRDNLLFDNEGQLGLFLARFNEQRQNPSVAIFEYKKSGKEFASGSVPIDPLRGIPEHLRRQLEAALEEFHLKAEDPRSTEEAREFINSLRLADPKSSPDMYRLYKDGPKDRLLVLWGCNRRGSSPLMPLDAVQRIPTYRASVLPKVLAALGAVAAVLLLLLLLSLFQGGGKEDRAKIASAGGPTTNPAKNSGSGQSLVAADSKQASAPNSSGAEKNTSAGPQRDSGTGSSSGTKPISGAGASEIKGDASKPNDGSGNLVDTPDYKGKSTNSDMKRVPNPNALPTKSEPMGDNTPDIVKKTTADSNNSPVSRVTASSATQPNATSANSKPEPSKTLDRLEPPAADPSGENTVSSASTAAPNKGSQTTPKKAEPIKPPYLIVSSNVLSLGEQISIEAKVEGWLTIDGHDELKAIDKTWMAPGKPAVRRLRAGIRTLQFTPDGEEYKGKQDTRAVAVYTPPEVAGRVVTLLLEGNLDLRNLSVDWGDNSPVELLVRKQKFTHEYEKGGSYTIKIVPPQNLSWAKKTFVVTVE